MTLLAVDNDFSGALVTVNSGATRTVVLVGRLAFKFPCVIHGWRPFLRGLIANAVEREWWHSGCNDGLCPIYLGIPGGWLNVMPRCEPVVDVDKVFDAFVNRESCCEHTDDVHVIGGPCALCDIDEPWHDYDPGWMIPAENKDDSFGWLGGDGGQLVAVDYGG